MQCTIYALPFTLSLSHTWMMAVVPPFQLHVHVLGRNVEPLLVYDIVHLCFALLSRLRLRLSSTFTLTLVFEFEFDDTDFGMCS